MGAVPAGLLRWRGRILAVRDLTTTWARSGYAPAFFSWSVGSADDSLRIHRWARASAFAEHPPLRWYALWTRLVVWPLSSLVLARRCVARFGPAVRDAERKRLRRQVLEQLWLAWFHSVSPIDYYTYGLHRPELFRRSTRFLFRNECHALFQALNDDPSAASLADKLRLERHLASHGIAAAPSLAWTRDGTVWFAEPGRGSLPEHDLFVKPLAGYGGSGAMLWEYIGGGLFRSASAPAVCAGLGEPLPRVGRFAVLHAADLLDLLRRIGASRDWLVQPRLANHGAVEELSGGALLGLRVLTGAVDGRAESLCAVFKMPIRDEITVNFGLVAPVDEATGLLGAATDFGPGRARYPHHPHTGAAIAGRLLPDWDAARDLAVRAHASLPGYTFVAWDIALTPAGPVVLEGNAGWGPEALQKPHDSPLLDARFAQICLARIDQLRARPRRARAAFDRAAAGDV